MLYLRRFGLSLLGTMILSSGALSGRTLYVDTEKGDDGNLSALGSSNGSLSPLKTINKAILNAKEGDIILVAPTRIPIYQSIQINSVSGTIAEPIVIDGQGITLSGKREIRPEEWRMVSPGVYRLEGVFDSKISDQDVGALVQRFFVLWNGHPHHMGRSSKGRMPSLPLVQDLKSGEWTLDLKTRALFVALPAHESITQQKIAIPQLLNGLQTLGSSSCWKIKNIHVEHFLNDGFNFHGTGKNIILEDVSATECGDDGVSAHEECYITVRRFVAIGNSTGLCHIDQSRSDNENIRLEDNTAYDLMLLGEGEHVFRSTTIKSYGMGASVTGRCSVDIAGMEFKVKPESSATFRAKGDPKMKVTNFSGTLVFSQ